MKTVGPSNLSVFDDVSRHENEQFEKNCIHIISLGTVERFDIHVGPNFFKYIDGLFMRICFIYCEPRYLSYRIFDNLDSSLMRYAYS